MVDIFVSYARENRERVRPLVELLEAQGWSVFWDREILPGQQWSNVIEMHLMAAKAVIVVWSHASTTSDWVKAEAMAARDRGILIPARLDDCPIPLPFGLIQTADLNPGSGHAGGETAQQLLHHIASVIAKPATNLQAATHPVVGQANIFRRFNWINVFFEIEGRLSRRLYWLATLVFFSFFALLMFVIDSIVRATTSLPEAELRQRTFVAYFVITLYPSVAIAVKRFHDFGWSGWWAALVMSIVFICGSSASFLDDPSNLEEALAALILWTIYLAALVIPGLIPGSAATNRYGPPPK